MPLLETLDEFGDLLTAAAAARENCRAALVVPSPFGRIIIEQGATRARLPGLWADAGPAEWRAMAKAATTVAEILEENSREAAE